MGRTGCAPLATQLDLAPASTSNGPVTPAVTGPHLSNPCRSRDAYPLIFLAKGTRSVAHHAVYPCMLRNEDDSDGDGHESRHGWKPENGKTRTFFLSPCRKHRLMRI